MRLLSIGIYLMLTLTLINGMGSRSKIVQEPASSRKDPSISISPIKPINLIENTTDNNKKTAAPLKPLLSNNKNKKPNLIKKNLKPVTKKKSTKQSSKKNKEPIKQKKKV